MEGTENAVHGKQPGGVPRRAHCYLCRFILKTLLEMASLGVGWAVSKGRHDVTTEIAVKQWPEASSMKYPTGDRRFCPLADAVSVEDLDCLLIAKTAACVDRIGRQAPRALLGEGSGPPAGTHPRDAQFGSHFTKLLGRTFF